MNARLMRGKLPRKYKECMGDMADLAEKQLNFKSWKVPKLKEYLQVRGISVSNKKKEELIELTEKAHELGLELTDEGESVSDVVNKKLCTKDGSLPNPFNLHSDWTTYFTDAPKFTWGDLYCYLISKKGYDQESLKAYKSLEGYRLHWDGHVYNLQRNKNVYLEHHFIRFSVKPTEREKTPLGNKSTYDGWLILHKSGVVFSAHCPCIGGSDGACRHIGAALMELEDTLRQNTVVTCTSEKCMWKQRKRTHNESSNLEDMTFTKPEIGKKKKKAVKPSTRNYDPRRKAAVNSENLVERFRGLLINTVPSAVGLHVLPDHGLDEANEVTEEITEKNLERYLPSITDHGSASSQGQLFHLGCLSSYKNHPPSIDEIKQKAKAIKRKLDFNVHEINLVEKKTRLQSQESDWFSYRKGRITASKCKRVASLKPTTSPSKTIKELLVNNTPQTSAMLQGLQNKDNIAAAFVNKLDRDGKKGVSITKCGFFISKTHGFLGASPDGIINDPEEGTPGVVELKYIQVKPGETLTDVLLRQHICLKVQHNDAVIIQLNKNHKYYFQLYQQMFVTEYHWGFLIVQGTDGSLFYEKVNFRQEFWSPILKKMEHFFDTFLAYELAYPRVQLGLERFAF